MKKLEKQKKLAGTLYRTGVIAFFAAIGWGLAAGLFLYLKGYAGRAIYGGILAALLALFSIGLYFGRNIEKKYIKNLLSMISVEDLLKEEGFNVSFFPERRLERDQLAYMGAALSRADGDDLISGSYNGIPFRSSFLVLSLEGRSPSVGIRLYRGRVSILGVKKAFSGKTLFLRRSLSEAGGLTKDGSRMLINSAGFRKKPETDTGLLRYSVYSDDGPALQKLLAKESGIMEKLDASRIDFILCSSFSIIFGSQNTLVFDRYGVSKNDVEKSTRESIQSISNDIFCVLPLREMTEI